MTLRSWLIRFRNGTRHLFIGAWPFWLLVSGLVIAAVLIPFSGTMRAGTILQVLGVATVAYGLTGRRRIFEQRTVREATLEWLRGLAAAFGPPRTISGAGTATAHVRVSGTGRATRRPTAGASLEERVSVLEAEVFTRLTDDLDRHVGELRKEIERVASETEREKAERLQDHSALQRRLEKTAVGELAVERVGLCWLIVGLLMTTLA